MRSLSRSASGLVLLGIAVLVAGCSGDVAVEARQRAAAGKPLDDGGGRRRV